MDWLKKILGEAYTDEIGKKVSDEIKNSYISKADHDIITGAKKELEGQLKDRDKQLEELKKVDAASLQDEIAKLQTENKTMKETYESKLKQSEMDKALDLALLGSKAHDPKAVKPYLDLKMVKLEEGKLIGLEEQLKGLKKEKEFLFEARESGSDTIRVDSGAEHGEGIGGVDAFVASARKAAGLPDIKE